ncbi:hypothetical protein FB451DRAFT_1376227 [Mycena latifolia]|nr:hypothetical protein FB451DRAFT_1376227 [Mycena latifolia]
MKEKKMKKKKAEQMNIYVTALGWISPPHGNHGIMDISALHFGPEFPGVILPVSRKSRVGYTVTMLRLPPELLELIFARLTRRDLWALARVSSRLRRLALLPFLAHYAITPAHLHSGALALPAEHAFLLSIITHIAPLHKLEVQRGRFAREGPGALPAILGCVPPIADVVVHNSYGQFANGAGMAKVLAALSPARTLVFAGQGTVRVVRPRSIGRVDCRWNAPLASDALLFLLPAALAYLIYGALTLVRLCARVSGSCCPDAAADPGADLGAVHAHWMRVQSLLPGTPEAFTLVTLASPAHPVWTVPPPARLDLTCTQRISLLGALEVPAFVEKVTIAES